MVRCFEDDDIIHVAGKVDPLDDVDVINLELALADLGTIEKRLERMRKGKKSKEEADKARAAPGPFCLFSGRGGEGVRLVVGKGAAEHAVRESPAAHPPPRPSFARQAAIEEEALTRLTAALEAGKAARTVPLSEDEAPLIRSLCLLTAKPLIYAANVNEEDLANKGATNPHVAALRKRAAEEGIEVVVVSAKVEAELNELPKEEAREWLESLGVTDGGLANLIRATYTTLGLRTYFTTGEKETRAWTIRAGWTAPQAAGVIHSDLEKGFIRAETVAYDDFIKHNGFAGNKEAGTLRLEGKEYVVAEGDVLLFRSGI